MLLSLILKLIFIVLSYFTLHYFWLFLAIVGYFTLGYLQLLYVITIIISKFLGYLQLCEVIIG